MTNPTEPRQNIYMCNHSAQNIETCPHCPEIIRMIQTNTRLFNIREIFLKMLTNMGIDYTDHETGLAPLTPEEKAILDELVHEANK